MRTLNNEHKQEFCCNLLYFYITLHYISFFCHKLLEITIERYANMQLTITFYSCWTFYAFKNSKGFLYGLRSAGLYIVLCKELFYTKFTLFSKCWLFNVFIIYIASPFLNPSAIVAIKMLHQTFKRNTQFIKQFSKSTHLHSTNTF